MSNNHDKTGFPLNSKAQYDRSAEPGRARAEFLLAAAVVALGVYHLAGIAEIEVVGGYDRIGPRFFPFAVAMGLILLGGCLIGVAIRSGRSTRAGSAHGAPHLSLRWSALGYVGLALLVTVLLLERAGFVIATSLQFWLTTRAFGSRRPVRDGVVALVLSAVVYLAFSHLLGLHLPPGILEGVSH